jgi:uroporphyrinogen III methyltransferase/synthase
MTMPVNQRDAQAVTPLQGKRILVTRPRERASRFATLLQQYGAEPIEMPTIEIIPPASWDPLDRAIAALPSYDWLVFTSVTGVQAFFARCALQPTAAVGGQKPHLCAIGPETAKALQTRGLRVEVMPQEYRAEAVVDALAAFPLAGRRVLLCRAAVARDVLPRALTAYGAHVDVVEAYRTVLPTGGFDPDVRERLARGEIAVVTFTSSSTVANFAMLIGETDLSHLLHDIVVACIGPVTAETARAYGLTPTVVATEYTIPGLTRALVEHFQESQATSAEA